jgi:hypothetical protein
MKSLPSIIGATAKRGILKLLYFLSLSAIYRSILKPVPVSFVVNRAHFGYDLQQML